MLEDVAFGPLNLGKSREEAIEISRVTLSFLGLDGFEERITIKLSGGEKRLVALATVLAMAPEVLLLDEPSAGLDEVTKHRLVHTLKTLDISYVIVSHEFDFLSEVTDKIYTLRNGRIEIDTPPVSTNMCMPMPMANSPIGISDKQPGVTLFYTEDPRHSAHIVHPR